MTPSKNREVTNAVGDRHFRRAIESCIGHATKPQEEVTFLGKDHEKLKSLGPGTIHPEDSKL